jgi:tripartite-type tricarboxylate transporter receptor subunit TctC
VRSGKLRALAVSSPARISEAPDIPTAKEAGVTDFEALFAFVMQVPAATPPAVQAFIGHHVTAVFELPEFRQRLQAIGVDPRSSTPAEARAWLVRETERWNKVIKATGMKVD